MTHSALILASSADTATGVGIPLALAAGFVSFLSPCVLPLVPGYLSTVIGSTLNEHKQLLERIGGGVIILLGLVFLASPFVRVLNFQWHSASLLRFAGRGGPLVAGAAFAIAWTPCTSITLGAILTQAAISSSAAHGALLLAFYSAGLAIPFLLIALAFEKMTDALG